MIAAGVARRWLMASAPIPPREWLRAGLGTLLGIAITGALSSWWLGAVNGMPALIAPIGASSVLLFAVPASPLAQPRALLGGNFVSALVGVTLAQLVHEPIMAAALAVSVAIMAMAVTRCLHPPSGAVAMTAVLGGPHVLAAGYWFVAAPVMLNSAILLAVALAFHRLSGRSYPHRAHPVEHPATPVIGALQSSDYAAVIADYGEQLTIGADDLEQLFKELSARACRPARQ